MKTQLLFIGALILSANLSAQTGGPDAAGYTYESSDAVGGPTYNWIELDTTLGGVGTASTANGVFDGRQYDVPLSFTFPFYGNDYNSLTIHTNGTVYFENTNLTWANVCMPGDPVIGFSGDTAIIATVWQAISTQGSGAVYYQDFSTYFVIEYSDVPEWGEIDGDTWELILYDDGDIIMQFKETSFTNGWGHTTGIQGSPTVGLDYFCAGGGDPIHDSLAILWTSPFIGITELEKNDISIHPNPSIGEFELSIPSTINDNYSIEIINLRGKVIYSNTFEYSNGTERISLENPTSGIYYLTIYDDLNRITKKIVLE